MKKTLVLLVLLLLSFSVFAATVTVAYLDRSETNLEASSFIKKQAKSDNFPHSFIFVPQLSALKGNEKVVVILNSGLASGIDPRISTYLTSHQNNQAIILVNLYSLGNNILVTSITSANSVNGVDEISAATLWQKKDTANQTMHRQWTSELFRLIQVKLAL